MAKAHCWPSPSPPIAMRGTRSRWAASGSPRCCNEALPRCCAARGLVARVLAKVARGAARSRSPATLLPGAVLLRSGFPLGAPPIPLQGVWTADDGGLPPWKGDYHHDLNTQTDVHRLSDGRTIRRGPLFPGFPLESAAGVPPIRPGNSTMLRERPCRASCRWTASRWAVGPCIRSAPPTPAGSDTSSTSTGATPWTRPFCAIGPIRGVPRSANV